MNIEAPITNITGKAITRTKTTNVAIGCGVFVILMILGAYIRIPLFFTPVPITLQTFFVLLSGAMLGKRWGALSQISYLFLGSLGLPVFEGYGAGMAHLFGPTGGYLFGFVCASYLVGYLLKQDKTSGMFKVSISMMAGLVMIYVFGIAWLKLFLGTSLSTTLIFGFYPFLPGALIKLIAASSIYMSLRGRF